MASHNRRQPRRSRRHNPARPHREGRPTDAARTHVHIPTDTDFEQWDHTFHERGEHVGLRQPEDSHSFGTPEAPKPPTPGDK